jgi:Uri superfamily endonuclease
MEEGIYTLILWLDSSESIRVGALGEIEFKRGCYTYTGSARGPGGLARVKRHMRGISGECKTRRWHIDHLLPKVSLSEVAIIRTASDLECQIARDIGVSLEPVLGFGSSDCRCQSHLHYSHDLNEAADVVKLAYGKAEISRLLGLSRDGRL